MSVAEKALQRAVTVWLCLWAGIFWTTLITSPDFEAKPSADESKPRRVDRRAIGVLARTAPSDQVKSTQAFANALEVRELGENEEPEPANPAGAAHRAGGRHRPHRPNTSAGGNAHLPVERLPAFTTVWKQLAATGNPLPDSVEFSIKELGGDYFGALHRIGGHVYAHIGRDVLIAQRVVELIGDGQPREVSVKAIKTDGFVNRLLNDMSDNTEVRRAGEMLGVPSGNLTLTVFKPADLWRAEKVRADQLLEANGFDPKKTLAFDVKYGQLSQGEFELVFLHARSQ